MSILFELSTVDNNLNDTQSGSQPGKKSHNFNFAPQINVKQELNIDLLVRDNARKKLSLSSYMSIIRNKIDWTVVKFIENRSNDKCEELTIQNRIL